MRPFPAAPSLAANPVACWNEIGSRGDKTCPALPQHIHCRNCPVYASAADALFDREPPANYLAQWTAHYAQAAAATTATLHSVVVFRLGGEWLALPTAFFNEVAEWRPWHSLPHRTVGTVLGLVNVRGQLMVCISLGGLLGIDPATPVEKSATRLPPRLLVIAQESRRAAFPADEVHGTLRYRDDEVKPTPMTVAKAGAAYTHGVLSWRERTIGLLDGPRLFATLSRSLG